MVCMSTSKGRGLQVQSRVIISHHNCLGVAFQGSQKGHLCISGDIFFMKGCAANHQLTFGPTKKSGPGKHFFFFCFCFVCCFFFFFWEGGGLWVLGVWGLKRWKCGRILVQPCEATTFLASGGRILRALGSSENKKKQSQLADVPAWDSGSVFSFFLGHLWICVCFLSFSFFWTCASWPHTWVFGALVFFSPHNFDFGKQEPQKKKARAHKTKL